MKSFIGVNPDNYNFHFAKGFILLKDIVVKGLNTKWDDVVGLEDGKTVLKKDFYCMDLLALVRMLI